MLFGGEMGLKNPKVVGLPALWRAIPKVVALCQALRRSNPTSGVEKRGLPLNEPDRIISLES